MSTRPTRSIATVLATLVTIGVTSLGVPGDAAARAVRNTTRTNINGGANLDRNVNVNQHFNRDVNVNRNVDVNRDIHVDRDIDVDADWHGGWGYHPVATAAGVAAAATVTAAAIGSMVYSLPPACAPVVMYGVTYQNCGGVWYQPQFAGTQVSYVVVNAPR